MPCYTPLVARKLASGGVTFITGGLSRDQSLAMGCIDIPCGQCLGCRLQRARDWSLRIMHEAQMHPQNCFVTLTYNEQNLPPSNQLNYTHFQLFMKRLRFRYKATRIRFYMCGEYGEATQRPHYHACLFNWMPPDQKLYSKRDGLRLYSSETLDGLWALGETKTGALTLQSAGYTARYIMAKRTGNHPGAKPVPEFNKMSLRPGIGATWLERFRSDVFPCDYVVHSDGQKDRVPKYYDKLNDRAHPELLEAVKLARTLSAQAHWEDNTSARLKVKAQVKAAAVRQLPRSL